MIEDPEQRQAAPIGREQAEVIARALMDAPNRRQQKVVERRLRRRLRWQRWCSANRRALPLALLATALAFVVARLCGFGEAAVPALSTGRLLLRCLGWVGLPTLLLVRGWLLRRAREPERIIEA